MLFPIPTSLVIALFSLVARADIDITGPLPFGTSTDPWKARQVPETTIPVPPSFSPRGFPSARDVDAVTSATAESAKKTSSTKTKTVTDNDTETTITSTTVINGQTSVIVTTKSSSRGAVSFNVDHVLVPAAFAVVGLIVGASAVF
ncbi:hypothetical protein L202_04748 [Cryptococcus amylolentus CBS 6039]|uniref:Uncharacterized protein n=2 Tax=Cryptococcus amylolentus TaxID=104669 RepID=A0A1E3HMK9_9TREE|nr:hypothetical protein L202_04748 [Cryptococcus amylolentus CBS 6039]ODN77580.1 hypothetical protein L202_04748 [Cryptococcus amylolentus CBS 6039]ODO05615.1 hypothetical protein I350_04674 [Cryptococcus amylolentus CBS 6273]